MSLAELGCLNLTHTFSRHVSQKELSTITQDKPEIRTGKQPIPYLAVTFHPAIIGVFLTCIGMVFGYTVLLYYGPSYLNKVRVSVSKQINQLILHVPGPGS